MAIVSASTKIVDVKKIHTAMFATLPKSEVNRLGITKTLTPDFVREFAAGTYDSAIKRFFQRIAKTMVRIPQDPRAPEVTSALRVLRRHAGLPN